MDIDLKDRRFLEDSIILAFIFSAILLLFLSLFYILAENFMLKSNLFGIFFIFGFFGVVVGFLFFRALLERYIKENKKLDNLLKETIHELNIPVSTILANCAMLSANESDLKKIKRLKRVELAAKSLSKQYEELEYEIRSQIKKPKIEEFFLDDLVYEAILLFGEIDKVEIETELKRTEIRGDRVGYLKVLINLIDNAIKYSYRGGKVKISLQDNILRVCDNGVGISEDMILKIFDRYFQIDTISDGFGIGLGFVKEFCDENGIDIRINSKLKEGSEFALFIDNR